MNAAFVGARERLGTQHDRLAQLLAFLSGEAGRREGVPREALIALTLDALERHLAVEAAWAERLEAAGREAGLVADVRAAHEGLGKRMLSLADVRQDDAPDVALAELVALLRAGAPYGTAALRGALGELPTTERPLKSERGAFSSSSSLLGGER